MDFTIEDTVKTDVNFEALAHTALTERRVPALLSANGAVVLERIARGGGATRWYLCCSTADLEKLEKKLSPGSVVSFYFDDRIRRSKVSPELVAEIQRIVAETGDAVVGTLGKDGVEIDTEIIVSPVDLREFAAGVPSDLELFYGAFPARDDDGAKAITVTLPDSDGVVRGHPH